MPLRRISATWENAKMAERLEYSGDALPSGLPGFGGGTVNVLILPGFNRVVAAQKFGPVNDASNVTVPDSVPPAGSNPENPTDEIVTPAPAPPPPTNISGELGKKLDKRPPCQDVFTFFKHLKDNCNYYFDSFTICDGGSAVNYELFRDAN